MHEINISYHDPGKMKVEDRIKEISRILAVGFLRHIIPERARNRLDDVEQESPHVTVKETNMEVA